MNLKVKCNARNLFVDPVFKANSQSLYYNSKTSFKIEMDSYEIEWLRPEVKFSISSEMKIIVKINCKNNKKINRKFAK